MAAPLDFSDLTGKKKKVAPQQTNAQGFYSPDKVPEEVHTKQPHGLGDPVNKTQSGDELMQLFPVPLLICPYPVDYSKELEWIRNSECRKQNEGDGTGPGKIHYNRQSEDTFVLDRPELANVRAFIEAKLHEYVTGIMASNDKMVITQSWLNKNKKSSSIPQHIQEKANFVNNTQGFYSPDRFLKRRNHNQQQWVILHNRLQVVMS